MWFASSSLADRLMSWENSGSNHGTSGGSQHGMVTEVWSQACCPQQPVQVTALWLSVPLLTKGSVWWAGQLFLKQHDSSCNCIFMCFVSSCVLMYVFVGILIKRLLLVCSLNIRIFFLSRNTFLHWQPRIYVIIPIVRCEEMFIYDSSKHHLPVRGAIFDWIWCHYHTALWKRVCTPVD